MSEKPTTTQDLTADELLVLEMYRQGKAAQAEKPAPAPEPPDVVIHPRYEYPYAGEDYQMALHIVSSLAFAKLLPSDLLDADRSGEGKLLFYFIENIAYAVSTGLDQIDIPALIKVHK